MPHPLFSSAAGRSSRAGLTRVELAVFLLVVLVLATVAMVPIRHHLEKARISRAAENARIISTLLSQYATDNEGVYPTGLDTPAAGKSEGVARNLLANNYTPDPGIFALGSAARYGGTAPDFSDFAAANIGWDFTGGATAATGITPAAPDLLPTVYATGESVTYPKTAGTGLDLPLSGHGPFGLGGTVVGYKSDRASFIPGTQSGAAVECRGFISKALKDTGPYTQIKP